VKPPPRPTIALVAHAVHDHGGMERAFAELVRRAHDRYRFVVFSAELAPELRPLVEWRRIRVPMRPIPLKHFAFACVAGLRLARARVDLVHTMGALVPNRCDIASAQFCVAGLREKTGRLSPPDLPPIRRLNTTLAKALGLLLEKWCYRAGRLRAFAVVSPGVGRELARHYPGTSMRVTPNGVDIDRFRPDEDERRQLRTAERVGPDETVVLFVGGDWGRKGLEVAMEGIAAARANGAGPLRLWVLGKGDEARYSERGRRLGLGDVVRFFGPRSDAERFFRAADVFLLPTLYEGAPLVSYEAAAASLPVVATPVNGVEDLLAEGTAGVAVRRDPVELAAVLSRLSNDPELRRRLGRGAREAALAFRWERSVESVVRIYRELLEEA
jgi:glycosyltransferase involved in cell wall biosynthesis